MGNLEVRKTSLDVFPLDGEYQTIIKCLARRGPQNMNQISQYSKDDRVPVKREAVKNRINGARGIEGLTRTGYLFEKVEEKKRGGNNERMFFLTPKGILSSLHHTPLKKNIIFNRYFEIVKNLVDVKLPMQFLTDYVESQIKLFLTCLSIQGIHLTWHRNFGLYFFDFLRHIEYEVNLRIDDKGILDEFRKIVVEYFVHHNAFVYLVRPCIEEFNNFPNMFYYKKDLRSSSGPKFWSGYFYKWTIGFDQVLMEEDEDRIKKITRPPHQVVFNPFTMDWLAYKPKVEKKLKELGIRKIVFEK